MRAAVTAIFLAGVLASAAIAGEADVAAAQATRAGNGTFRFEVTVRHGDEGWDHYADKWDVVAPDGTILATRVLLHPHENEQPFTRFLGGVAIPDGIDRVTLRAHDKTHGYGGAELTVELRR
ncbi:MAG: hypothetical protein HOH66_00740 [Rhodospirillaceae bacterium]|jgi:hypothetical protein|nr:hypothetical protein [Rhodospirillaceae bacterium]MBT6116375.1 hypothetical protein [Rhodospirillaceae bacterium]